MLVTNDWGDFRLAPVLKTVPSLFLFYYKSWCKSNLYSCSKSNSDGCVLNMAKEIGFV